MKKLKVERKELKYLINEFDKLYLANMFGTLLESDKHNGDHGYKVRSLYFDSVFDGDYYAKINGEKIRKKIRLRIYGVEDKEVKLEVKRKFNTNQRKDTLIISKGDANELIKMNYGVLFKYNDPLAIEVYNIMKTGSYRPVVMIEYERLAYLNAIHNTRLTLDFNIRKSETNFQLFDISPANIPIFEYPYTVLEVKESTYMFNWINELIAKCNCTQKSVSKYCLSRTIFEGYFA